MPEVSLVCAGMSNQSAAVVGQGVVLTAVPGPVSQSLDPLPMRGPELGVQADDIEALEVEHEPKQEVLENKNVRTGSILFVF